MKKVVITRWNISNLAIFEPGEKGVFLAFDIFATQEKTFMEGKQDNGKMPTSYRQIYKYQKKVFVIAILFRGP